MDETKWALVSVNIVRKFEAKNLSYDTRGQKWSTPYHRNKEEWNWENSLKILSRIIIIFYPIENKVNAQTKTEMDPSQIPLIMSNTCSQPHPFSIL